MIGKPKAVHFLVVLTSLFLMTFFISLSAAAYTPPPITPPEDNASKQANSNQNNAHSNPTGNLTEEQKYEWARVMSLYVLAFGLILAVFTGAIAIITRGWNRETTNIFTVTIIITAGLFLMTAGYDSSQIAPMYGLLGTIVGYLLGKARPTEQEAKSNQ